LLWLGAGKSTLAHQPSVTTQGFAARATYINTKFNDDFAEDVARRWT